MFYLKFLRLFEERTVLSLLAILCRVFLYGPSEEEKERIGIYKLSFTINLCKCVHTCNLYSLFVHLQLFFFIQVSLPFGYLSTNVLPLINRRSSLYNCNNKYDQKPYFFFKYAFYVAVNIVIDLQTPEVIMYDVFVFFLRSKKIKKTKYSELGIIYLSRN